MDSRIKRAGMDTSPINISMTDLHRAPKSGNKSGI